VNRRIFALAAFTVVACNKEQATSVQVQTATVQRRDIVVNAEATGVIEPIQVVEVKSKTASGQVLDMGIEVGSYVRPGDLIVQLDTTDLHTTLLQNLADLEAARSAYNVAKTVLERNTALFDQRVITKDVLEQSQNSEANSRASLNRAETQVTIQKQRITDSRVVAAVEGTVLTRPVAKGQVIQAGSGGVSAGTVIATMADLSQVRARALVSETEIGQLQLGQDAVVTVDAFPERAFNGTVEKVEPQAVVQQNVTMFPVLVSLDNSEGLLRPGMNGEVSVRTDERQGVLSVPNDAIRSTREYEQAAKALGLNPDSVRAAVMPSGGRGGMGGGRGGNGGGAPGAGGMTAPGGSAGGGNPPGGGRQGGQAQTSRAEISFALVQGGNQAGNQGGGRRGGGGGRGFQMPEVSDADCKKVDDALKAKPAVAKRLDDLRTQMRDPNADREAMRATMESAYRDLGVDQQVANACRFRQGGGGRGGMNMGGQNAAGPQGPNAAARGGNQGGQQANAMGGGRAGGRNGGGFGGGFGGGRQGARGRTDPNATPRSGMVFVQKEAGGWEPRVLRLGIANYDFTEVVSGLEEGERVALMAAAILQLRRQEQMDRTRAMASPLGGGGMGGGRGGMGGPPGGGGGGPGGGGRGN